VKQEWSTEKFTSGFAAAISSGWPAETDAAKFHEESRSLFQSAGWDLQPGGDSTSDTVTKGWQELYCIR